jgi:hypothetical protein
MFMLPSSYIHKKITKLQGTKTKPLIYVQKLNNKTREDVVQTYKHINHIVDKYPAKHIQLPLQNFIINNTHYTYYKEVIDIGLYYKCSFSLQLPNDDILPRYEYDALNRYILTEHNEEDINIYKVYDFEKQDCFKELMKDYKFTRTKLGVHFNVNQNASEYDNCIQALSYLSREVSENKSMAKILFTAFNDKQVEQFENIIMYLPKNDKISLVSYNYHPLESKPYDIYKAISSV